MACPSTTIFRSAAIALAVFSSRAESAAAEPAGSGPAGAGTGREALALRSGPCALALDPASGSLARFEDRAGREPVSWFAGPLGLEVRRESDGETSRPELLRAATESGPGGAAPRIRVVRKFPTLGLETREVWSEAAGVFEWRIAFEGGAPRSGHEVRLELPILEPARSVFAPTERGAMDLGAYPSFELVPYAHVGWGDGRYHVLPLVAAFDPKAGRGLTAALPPEPPIPHLQVSWREARLLEIRLGHRALGGGAPAEIRILFYASDDDRRAVVGAYAAAFPQYFLPGLPRGPHEGAFWYHHIHDRPSFEELARQDVRYLWASFWFTHLGEYLPDAAEWHPYTYARWWKLGETMTDARIRAFVKELSDRGIGTFAYLNLTEYGGAGGSEGDSREAERRFREGLEDALVRGEDGRPIPTWEGAFAVTPRPGGPLLPVLRKEVERHLERLPEIAGFVIDRLDWASAYDWGHADGISMVGTREVECLAGPVAAALAEVSRLAHAAGKRVFVNQFWRVEALRDVDGYCHEYDYPRGLGYLAPFRPAAAWHQERPYSGDLLAFEAQLKSRLLFAIFPHMIAREFPISQQAPDPEAADLLEVYAPLFAPLRGKVQVLAARCVEADGPDEANLFADPTSGVYAAAVVSRVHFLSRGGARPAPARVRVRVPDALGLAWVHVRSAEGPPARGTLERRGDAAEATLPAHATASVAIFGSAPEPELDLRLEDSAASARSRLRAALGTGDPRDDALRPEGEVPGARDPTAPARGAAPEPTSWTLLVRGEHVGTPGAVEIALGRAVLGRLEGARGRHALPGKPDPDAALEIRTFDDGTWFVPERVVLAGFFPGGGGREVARWRSGDRAGGSGPRRIALRLAATAAPAVARNPPAFAGRESARGGAWTGACGSLAAWIPGVSEPEHPGGFRLRVLSGRAFTWSPSTGDPRVLEARRSPPAGTEAPRAAERPSTCWFESSRLAFAVEPPGEERYRVAVYIVDYDRNGRSARARIETDLEESAWEEVSREEAAAGVYLLWSAEGPVELAIEKLGGANVVASGIFVDPE